MGNCKVDRIVEALSTDFMFVDPEHNVRAGMGGKMSAS
jgi:hypothetical protein